MTEIPEPWKKKERSSEDVLAESRASMSVRHGVRGDETLPNSDVDTGDSARDAAIIQHRKERDGLRRRIARVKALADDDSTKPRAIARLRGLMAEFNSAAFKNPEYWTDDELTEFTLSSDVNTGDAARDAIILANREKIRGLNLRITRFNADPARGAEADDFLEKQGAALVADSKDHPERYFTDEQISAGVAIA